MTLSRRGFLGGAAAFAGLGGCRSLTEVFGREPDLRFGVVSDIHVTTPDSTEMFERALRYFRDRHVDAVMIPGDLTDWGLMSGFRYVEEAWQRVFPGGKGADGRPVTKLFCTGNHDYEGFWYGDMTVEMHAHGYSEREAVVDLGMKKCWEEAFHEEWAPIRARTVKGYTFISGEWKCDVDKSDGFNLLPDYLAKHGAELAGDKPFFYFQHPPISGTTGDSRRKNGGTYPFQNVTDALKKFPNAISFTGHCHWTFNDEKSIWQNEFTAIATPSLSYMTIPAGYENGYAKRRPTVTESMPVIDSRLNLRGGQGYVVNVWGDHVEIERRDLEEGEEGARAWSFPVPVAKSAKPYTDEPRAKTTPVPEFPAGATLKTYTRNGELRNNQWAIFMMLDFPAATASCVRAFDYEARLVLADGKTHAVKRFLSPAFHKLAKHEPARMRFYFNANDLPQGVEYHIEVAPRNSFGQAGRAIVSRKWHGKPGLDKVIDRIKGKK